MLGRANALGQLTEFWKIIREMNPDVIEREANERFSLAIIGPDGPNKTEMAAALAGGRPVLAGALNIGNTNGMNGARDLPAADLYVYALPASKATSVEYAHAINDVEAGGKPVVLAICRDGSNLPDRELLDASDYLFSTLPSHRIVVVDDNDPSDVVDKLVPAIMTSLPHLHLSLARTLPGFREKVAASLIMEVSRVNAEFALFSSLPANIPVIGEIMATGADLFVLTKNQVMMIFKLAAVYGRNFDSKPRIALEIAPVVGGAFLWRTAARTMVGVLPGLLAAVPKTLVAFVGTFVVGSIASYYYHIGRKPTKKLMDQFRQDAMSFASAHLRGWKDASSL
ncbi:MAG: hypothetical protein M1358_10390 [Chloroflexi bacterium]|nr:hypothetical protein [Chloroflexota bacterium]